MLSVDEVGEIKEAEETEETRALGRDVSQNVPSSIHIYYLYTYMKIPS